MIVENVSCRCHYHFIQCEVVVLAEELGVIIVVNCVVGPLGEEARISIIQIPARNHNIINNINDVIDIVPFGNEFVDYGVVELGNFFCTVAEEADDESYLNHNWEEYNDGNDESSPLVVLSFVVQS